MTPIVIAFGLAVALLVLVRRGLVFVDMSFPWLVAIIVLGFLSSSDRFVDGVGRMLGILYPPIAIVFLSIFVIFGLITVLLIGYSQLRQRQMHLLRYVASFELGRQEAAIETASDKQRR